VLSFSVNFVRYPIGIDLGVHSSAPDRVYAAGDYYHVPLSGVYALTNPPRLDLLMTGGRDSDAAWDMGQGSNPLSGRSATVASILPGATDPQIITGSHDTIHIWDIRTGRDGGYAHVPQAQRARSLCIAP
jgi:WD40 repeat protein